MNLFGKNLKHQSVLVAEIGLNHEGRVSKAKKLILLAKKAGADAVKFQSYTLEKYCSTSEKKRYKMLKKFSFSKKQFLDIFRYCKKVKINCFSTAVTEDYVNFLAKENGIIKIASGDSTFKPLLFKAAKSGAKIILSTGGTTFKEIIKSINYIKKYSKIDIKKKLIILHCISAYPVPIKEVNLQTIPFLKKKTKLIVGYSNHSCNPFVSAMALNFGAKVIEVHFTDNKKNKSIRDHALSFDFNDLKHIAEYKNNIKKISGYINKKIQKSEKANIPIIRKGIVASNNIKKLKIIEPFDLQFARPANNFSYEEAYKLIGKKIKFNKKKGEVIQRNDF
jgi:N,N'-diacetyllegionaminate synthase